MENTKSISPKNQKDWRRWLEKNHDRQQGVWVVHFKLREGSPLCIKPHTDRNHRPTKHKHKCGVKEKIQVIP
jgi:hypothetical protein